MVIMNNNPSELMREKVKGYKEYIGDLEEEKKKIQVFERELPLCLHLVSQAIERFKEQMCGMNTNGECDEYFEQNSSGPFLEQFIPIKQTNEDDKENKHLSNKSDWLTSTQLSIQPIEKDLLSKRESCLEGNNIKGSSCGAFLPFQKKQASVSCSADTDDGGNGEDGDKGQSNNKKERRCWSPELHRRFLHALQQLGGAHVATPKQIRELMKVDGLTSDEIKSHLQKYRLHTRRLNHPTTHHETRTTHRLVVVGQIWMPPLEYTTNAAANNTKGVYSPIATRPPTLCQTKQWNQEEHPSL